MKLQTATKIPYELQPIFVTRRPVPAAFVNFHIPFARLQDLPRTLSNMERG
jgi:hypothetical protein